MRIPDKYIKLMTSKGLLLNSEPDFPSNHVAYPSGYGVINPTSTKGNQFEEEYGCAFHNGRPVPVDSPGLTIYFKNRLWNLEAEMPMGGEPCDVTIVKSESIEDIFNEALAFYLSPDYDFKPLREKGIL